MNTELLSVQEKLATLEMHTVSTLQRLAALQEEYVRETGDVFSEIRQLLSGIDGNLLDLQQKADFRGDIVFNLDSLEGWVDIVEAAKYLPLKRHSYIYHIKKGHVESKKIHGKWYITNESLVALKKSLDKRWGREK